MDHFKYKLLIFVLGFVFLFAISGMLVYAQGSNDDGDDTGQEPENPGVKEEQTDAGENGMVVSAHPAASKIGADVLDRGGNATDAAVAMQFALNVSEPMMSGIGGGGFMMHYDEDTEDVSIIDSRERAPDGATPDMFMDKSDIIQSPGQFLLSAIEMNEEGGGQFHIGEVSVDDLDASSDDPVFHEDFEGENGDTWDSEKFDLFERGTTFHMDDDGGQIEFGSPVHGNNSSFGRTTPQMDDIQNGELNVTFRTDDPGDDRRLRFWLRADDYRPGSTFAKNGYGVEVNTDTHEVKLIQSKDSASSYLKTIHYDTATDWQSLKFQVDDDRLKVKLWEDDSEEPEDWDISTEAGSVIPFSERVQMGEAVGVPGTLKGLETALDEWGTLPMDELIEPATKLADEGVEVNWVLADAIENNQEKLERSAAEDVFLPDSEPLEEGDLLVQEDLADTFRIIADEGSDAFYDGEIGDALSDVVQEFGGSMGPEDLHQYDITIDDPVWGDYQGYDVASMPPPSSGGLTVLQLLGMFEEAELSQYNVEAPEKYHNMTEMMHLAYADRNEYMGDPEYVDVPMEGLLDPDYIKDRLDTIDQDEANPDVEPGDPWEYQEGETNQSVEQDDNKIDSETTHFTVMDDEGNMVSYTTTIEQLFGTGIMVPDYGIILNNELTDFDAVPGGSNEVQPNKRPLSSMSPSMVFQDNEPYMTVGSPGGTTIITSVVQTILNSIGYDMDIKDAIEEPRIYSDEYPDIRWEYGIQGDVRYELEEMGHEWEDESTDIGNVNSIVVDQEKGVYQGAADSTREGMAIGIQEPSASYMKQISERFQSEGKYSDDSVARALGIHLEAISHYEDKEEGDKVVKHMESFKELIDDRKENENISEDAHETLEKYADEVIEEWQ